MQRVQVPGLKVQGLIRRVSHPWPLTADTCTLKRRSFRNATLPIALICAFQFLKMTLLQYIKNERAQQRKKKPLQQDVFNRISSLVRRYGLDESFLTVIENAEDYLNQINLELHRFREKLPFEDPMFSLVAQEEYVLTRAIVGKIDNPYLQYAHSPEEIFQSRLLYHLNPAIPAETLMRNHLETLLLYAYSKSKVEELIKNANEIEKKLDDEYENEMYYVIQPQLVAIHERITKLQNFIAKAEMVIA